MITVYRFFKTVSFQRHGNIYTFFSLHDLKLLSVKIYILFNRSLLFLLLIHVVGVDFWMNVKIIAAIDSIVANRKNGKFLKLRGYFFEDNQDKNSIKRTVF